MFVNEFATAKMVCMVENIFEDGKLPEYLVLVSGFFHNEYELCNIAY